MVVNIDETKYKFMLTILKLKKKNCITSKGNKCIQNVSRFVSGTKK